MKRVNYIFLFGLFVFFACSERENESLKMPIPKNLKMIGHKGSGTINENGNVGLIENTWKSIKNAIEKTDGSEIDLQLSGDSTLWIFHDHDLADCKDSVKNFFLYSDEQIRTISKCKFSGQLLTLDEFVLKTKGHNWKKKILSLDLKVLYNPITEDHFGDSKRLANSVAKLLKRALTGINMEVLLEVNNEEQFIVLKSQMPYRTFLVNYKPTKDFINEREHKLTPLSLPIDQLPQGTKFTPQNNVQLWTINGADQFFQALQYAPEYIQSDNIPMMQFFKKLQQGHELQLAASDSISIFGPVLEFYSLMELALENAPSLIRFNHDSNSFPKEVLLVMSVENNSGECVFWQGLTLVDETDRYFFIDGDFLKANRGKTVKFHIWNKGLSPIKLRGKTEKFVL